MLFKLSFHHVDHSEAFREFLADKFDKLNRKIPRLNDVSVVVDKEADKFDVKVAGRMGRKDIHVHASDKNIYKAAIKVFANLSEHAGRLNWLRKN